MVLVKILYKVFSDTDKHIVGCLVQDTETLKIGFVAKEQLNRYRYTNAKISDANRIYSIGKPIPIIPLSKLNQNRGRDTSEVYGDSSLARKRVILYHGSPNKTFTPEYGKGEDKHDYGRGFYLTEYAELAKEWAVCGGNSEGWLHTYELDMSGMTVFNFNKKHPLNWLAELMSHRDADNSSRYRRFAPEFIKKFKLDTRGADIIYDWRADSSYFSIGKRFVRNEIDYTLLSDLFHLGDLENQYCLVTPKAFSHLKEIRSPERVDSSYLKKYLDRDSHARKDMKKLINSQKNTMSKGFDYVLRKEFQIC